MTPLRYAALLQLSLIGWTANAATEPQPSRRLKTLQRPDTIPAPATTQLAPGVVTAPSVNSPPHRPHWLVPQLHAGALLLTARLGAAVIWPDDFGFSDGDQMVDNFLRAWSEPPRYRDTAGFFSLDGDGWPLNLVGHGALGSELYLRHRQAHHPPWVALLMTIAWSTTWEYLIESWNKQPSSVDLIWTPVAGVLVGELRYACYRWLRARPASGGRTILLYLIDPLGQLERDLIGLHF